MGKIANEKKTQQQQPIQRSVTKNRFNKCLGNRNFRYIFIHYDEEGGDEAFIYCTQALCVFIDRHKMLSLKGKNLIAMKA